MDKYTNLQKEIHKISSNKPSFIGMDGGNINSKVWFCGIEFGCTLNNMENYYKSNIQHYHSQKLNIPIPYRENAGDFEKSNYDLFLSEMIIKIFTIKNKSRNDYLNDILYNKNSDIFKLNLYPLGKKNTGWDKEITETFTISKEDYYSKIFNSRKRFLKQLVKVFKPKMIICTAIKNSELQFIEAFFGNKTRINYNKKHIEFKDLNNTVKKFKIIEVNNDELSLLIIPFPGMGRGNMNSYTDVINVANYIKDNYLY